MLSWPRGLQTGIVYCGASFADIYGSTSMSDAGAVLSDGAFAPAYAIDESRPECATWNRAGLPVRPQCEIVDSGMCPTSP